MKNILSIIVVILTIIFVMNIIKKDIWSGYFYPDINNLSNWIDGNTSFESLDSCRNWANNKARELKLEDNQYDYECGLNCKYKSGFNVCEETTD